MGPGPILLLPVRPAAFPYVVLSLVVPNRVVHNPDNDYVGMDPQPSPSEHQSSIIDLRKVDFRKSA